jgi:D-serine deaminase-like pyridoxal phosphate-dependent protein
MAMERLVLTGSILSLSAGNNSTSAGKYRKKRVNVHQSSSMPGRGAELCLVPGHRVATADLHDWFVGLRAGRVACGWPVATRVAIA